MTCYKNLMTKNQNSDIETRTAAAYRGVSGDIAGDVAFCGGQASLAVGGTRLIRKNRKMTARLPMPAQAEPLETQPHMRGAADGSALYQKYHCEDVNHARISHENADQLLNVLEQVRCEALGARAMQGVRQNLAAALENACNAKGYKDHAEITLEDSLYALAFEHFTGAQLCDTALKTADQIRLQVENSVGQGAFDTLAENLLDQTQFAKASEIFVRKLMNLDLPQSESRGNHDDGNQDDAAHDPSGQSQLQSDDGDQADQGEAAQPEDAQAASAEDIQAQNQQDQMGAGAEDDQKTDQDLDQNGEFDGESQDGVLPPNNPFGEVDRDYRIFTTEFDEVIEPSKLANATELKELRARLDDQLQPLQVMIGKLANRLQRLLMARQQRQWRFDQEEGIINPARLARIIADPMLPLTYKREVETDFKDTVLTLLIDNSGSMRGRPITTAALTADILARTLERAGVKVEILGFTTVNWKGGQSRNHWTLSGRSPSPGRLNDIRHIIYKQADAPLRRVRDHLGLMLKEGILKENIDGEALLWASKRLQKRPEDRKILMVISDGAPVDDSTLSANKGGYLESNLHKVIDHIEKQKNIELTAIGIGHDVGKYYKQAVTIKDVQHLPEVMMNELAGLFLQ